MRFMLMVKATKEIEAGVMPQESAIMEMMQFNEDLVKAGVLLAGEGLHPSSNGFRLTYQNGERTVTDGPFAETKELIAGFWIIDVKSKEEAMAWAKRIPVAVSPDESVIEVRQVFEAPELTDNPELLAQEADLRRRSEQSK